MEFDKKTSNILKSILLIAVIIAVFYFGSSLLRLNRAQELSQEEEGSVSDLSIDEIIKKSKEELNEKKDVKVNGNEKITVFNIQNNDEISSPVTISGEAVAFENNLIVELRNSDHESVVQEFATIKSAEAGERGSFSITMHFQFSNTKEGYVAVYEQSAKDGTELNLVEIPVKYGVLKNNL